MALKQRLANIIAIVALTAAAQAEGFIRVDEDDAAARLQTAITRYEKQGQSVELIGAVHIADKGYYEKLSTRFESYDSLLFEMIGGEKFAVKETPEPEVKVPAPAAKERNLTGLHQVYGMISRFLELSGQGECIDYTAKNFVHADLTNAEFTQMQNERGESVIGFAIKASKPGREAADQPDSTKLLKAMLSGRSDLVKLAVVHTLGKGDDQIAAFSGESVIITDRNNRCLEVMNRQLQSGQKNLGIFYGAAHFPDMEKRLLDQGFKRTKQEWLTAWDIPKIAVVKKKAA
jgi:hypothetical protein